MRLLNFSKISKIELTSVLLGLLGISLSLPLVLNQVSFLSNPSSSSPVRDIIGGKYYLSADSVSNTPLESNTDKNEDPKISFASNQNNSKLTPALSSTRFFLIQPKSMEVLNLSKRIKTPYLVTFEFEVDTKEDSSPTLEIRKGAQVLTTKSSLIPKHKKSTVQFYSVSHPLPEKGLYRWRVSFKDSESEERTLVIK